MVDRHILLERLETSCGIKGRLSSGSQPTFLIVLIPLSLVAHGHSAPQSSRALLIALSYVISCLSSTPLTFRLYLQRILWRVSFSRRCPGLCPIFHGPPSSQILFASKIDDVSQELHLWMSSNNLSLNSSKTRLIWFSTAQQLQKLHLPPLSYRFPHFTFLFSVRDLDITPERSFSFCNHIYNLTRSFYLHLRGLTAIRKHISTSVFTSVVHVWLFYITRFSLASLKFDYILPRPCSMPLLDSLLDFSDYLNPFFYDVTTTLASLHWI